MGSCQGRGWIEVRAEKPTTEEIMSAIAKGDFYASTGVTLKGYHSDAKSIALTVLPTKSDVTFATKFRIQFIAKDGRVVLDTTAVKATYQPKGDEGYVRIRVTDSNGRQAWTQPVFLDGRKAAEFTAK